MSFHFGVPLQSSQITHDVELNIQNDCSCLIIYRKNRKKRCFMKELMIKMIFIAFTSFYGEITLPECICSPMY